LTISEVKNKKRSGIREARRKPPQEPKQAG